MVISCYVRATETFAYLQSVSSHAQDALGVEAFQRSDHAFAAEELFNAYRSGTAAEVKSCVAAKAVFLDLDNQARGGLSLLFDVWL